MQGLDKCYDYIKNKGWFFFHTVMIWVLYLFST